MRADARCRSCGALLRWAQLPDGSHVGIDATPVTDGEFVEALMVDRWVDGRNVAWPEPVMVPYAADPDDQFPPSRYRAHVCPAAEGFDRG